MEALPQKENGGFAWVFDELYISRGITEARQRKHTNIDIKYSSLFVLHLRGALYFKCVWVPVKWQWCGNEAQWCLPHHGPSVTPLYGQWAQEKGFKTTMSPTWTLIIDLREKKPAHRGLHEEYCCNLQTACAEYATLFEMQIHCVCSEMKIHPVSCKIGDRKSRNWKMLISVEMQTGVYYKIW